MSTPLRAAAAMADTTETGVEMTSAHGHEITRSATTWFTATSTPRGTHRANVPAASTSTTATKYPAIRSARSAVGARRASASRTYASSRPTRVASPAASTATTSRAVRFVAPASTWSPTPTGSGRLSPVSTAASSVDAPATTAPAGCEGC